MRVSLSTFTSLLILSKKCLQIRYDSRTPDSVDIMSKFQKELPERFNTNSDSFLSELNNEEFKPPGKVLATKENGESSLAVFKTKLKNDENIDFHKRFEVLGLFFIDSASFISDYDDWRAYYLYECKKVGKERTRYTLLGCSTVYPFFHLPDKRRFRISQFLILPPFQKRGHGEFLLRSVYKHLRTKEDLFEITVESPSKDFQRFRTQADLLDYLEQLPIPLFHFRNYDLHNVRKLQDAMKITKSQAQKITEMLWLYNKLEDDKDFDVYSDPGFIKKLLLRIYHEKYDLFSALEKPKWKEYLLKHLAKTLEKHLELINKVSIKAK